MTYWLQGWRYRPNAHGIEPCGCKYCQLRQPYSRQIRARFEADNRSFFRANSQVSIVS